MVVPTAVSTIPASQMQQMSISLFLFMHLIFVQVLLLLCATFGGTGVSFLYSSSYGAAFCSRGEKSADNTLMFQLFSNIACTASRPFLPPRLLLPWGEAGGEGEAERGHS